MATPSSDITRRTLLAGGAAAGGAVAAAPAAGAAAVRTVGVPRSGRNAIEVIGSIVQDGTGLTGYGYLTRIDGLRERDLYAGSGRTEAAARFTFHSTATVTGRALRPSLFAVVATGELHFYLGTGGGDFAAPDSFARGTRIATCTARYQNLLTVISPDHALTTVLGELEQRAARTFAVAGRRHRLGRRGLVERLHATGPGTRTDPTVPRATFDVAGYLAAAG
jgi:hypothetical protein